MTQKRKDGWVILAGIAVLGVTSNSLLAFPRDGFPRGFERHRRDDGAFLLGVCVGEGLAQQALTIEQADDAVIQPLVENCRAKRDGTAPLPSPSLLPTPSPDPAPTPAPTPSSQAS